MVVALIVGVVKVFPLKRVVAVVLSSYQLIVPAEAMADKVIVPESHLAAGVVAIIVGALFTVAVTAVRAAVVQPLEVASTK